MERSKPLPEYSHKLCMLKALDNDQSSHLPLAFVKAQADLTLNIWFQLDASPGSHTSSLHLRGLRAFAFIKPSITQRVRMIVINWWIYEQWRGLRTRFTCDNSHCLTTDLFLRRHRRSSHRFPAVGLRREPSTPAALRPWLPQSTREVLGFSAEKPPSLPVLLTSRSNTPRGMYSYHKVKSWVDFVQIKRKKSQKHILVPV